MEPASLVGPVVGVANFAWNIGKAAWSRWHEHPRVTVQEAEIKDGGRAIVSIAVTNTLTEPIRLASVHAGSPLGASVGVVWGLIGWILEDGPPPFQWPDFEDTAAIGIDLDPGETEYFDVCVRRDPLIVFGSAVRIAATLNYETMGPKQKRRSITIVRTLQTPGRPLHLAAAAAAIFGSLFL